LVMFFFSTLFVQDVVHFGDSRSGVFFGVSFSTHCAEYIVKLAI
jgi:hypothetical protein